MSVKKLIAILIIFFGCFVSWMLLGGINADRTSKNTALLKTYVQNMYGGDINVSSPEVYVVMLGCSVLLKTNLHPVNYFFLAATFFSFHLMYSYFSDHLNIYLAFFIASFVSLLLTTSYLMRLTSAKFSIFAALAQFIYLIVFSFSFFFKGVAGLIVTIVAVITLFILMQLTAKVQWDAIFNKN